MRSVQVVHRGNVVEITDGVTTVVVFLYTFRLEFTSVVQVWMFNFVQEFKFYLQTDMFKFEY